MVLQRSCFGSNGLPRALLEECLHPEWRRFGLAAWPTRPIPWGVLKLLFIGDIVGKPGREIVEEKVARIRRESGVDFVIANGENSAAGSGITASIARSLLDSGVDAITLGDHVVIAARGFRVAVFTVLGRQYMNMKADDPFACADRMIERLKGQSDAIVVEIHAEATSEKQALGWHLDGRVTAVLGTHTHVPTADSCVLPKGTAFMCDVGMTGPYASVLGREVAPVISRFMDGMPRRFEVAAGDVRMSAALIDIDPAMASATKIELLTVRK